MWRPRPIRERAVIPKYDHSRNADLRAPHKATLREITHGNQQDALR